MKDIRRCAVRYAFERLLDFAVVLAAVGLTWCVVETITLVLK